jgi:hypothetical protein
VPVCAAMWVIAARDFPHSRQNTTSAMKSYHGVVLKKILKWTRNTSLSQDLQWLLHELKTVLAHYMHLVRSPTNFSSEKPPVHPISIICINFPSLM